jgi:hypothetical protein
MKVFGGGMEDRAAPQCVPRPLCLCWIKGGRRDGSKAIEFEGSKALVMRVYLDLGRYRRKREGAGTLTRAPTLSASPSNAPKKDQSYFTLQSLALGNAPCMWEAWYMIPRLPASFPRHLGVSLTSDSGHHFAIIDCA